MNKVISIPNSGLEAAIREALDEPSGDITTEDLAGLTELDAHGRNIRNLTGIEHCTSLKWLDLRDNLISDLSPLVANPGLGKGDEVLLWDNNLKRGEGSKAVEDIRALRARGVDVSY